MFTNVITFTIPGDVKEECRDQWLNQELVYFMQGKIPGYVRPEVRGLRKLERIDAYTWIAYYETDKPYQKPQGLNFRPTQKDVAAAKREKLNKEVGDSTKEGVSKGLSNSNLSQTASKARKSSSSR